MKPVFARIAIALAFLWAGGDASAATAKSYTTEVEGIGGKDCPLYKDSHSAAEQRKLFEMGQLAADSYKDGTAKPPAGYTPVTDAKTLEKYLGPNSGFSVSEDGTITKDGMWAVGSGFQAALYVGPEGLVLAIRGTDSIVDANADAEQAAGTGIPRQYDYAAELLGKLLDGTRENKTHIDMTGHSLGGGETQYAMAKNDLEGRVSGYTFNSAGLSGNTLRTIDPGRAKAAAEAMTNVRNRGDTVSSGAGRHFGEVYDYENPRFAAHGIGEIIGYDGNGDPVYDGFLGNIQRDLWNAEHPGRTVESSADLAENRNPDDLHFWEVREEAQKLFEDAQKLLSRQVDRTGACLCGGKDAAFDEAEKARLEYGFFLSGYLEAYGDTNPWLPVAMTSKLVGSSSALVFSYLEKAWFHTDWMSETLGVINSAIEKHGESGYGFVDSLATGYVGDPVDIGESLAAIIQELRAIDFKSVNSLENAVSVLEKVLSIKDELEKLQKAGERLQSWPELKGDFKAIQDKIDDVCAHLNVVIDAYKAATTTVGYFKGISNMRSKMKELLKKKAEYDALSATFSDLGTCECSSGCACSHCRPEEPDDGEEPGGETGGGGSGGGGSGGGGSGGGAGGSAPANPPGGTGGTGGPGTNPGTSGPTGPKKPENPYEGWFVYEDPGDGRDPWAPILSAVKGDQAGAKDSPGLLDVIGMGAFDDILVDANKLAGWAFESGQYAGVAENVWGAFSDGGENAVAMAETIGNAVVAQVKNWLEKRLDEAIGKLTAWANARLDVIVAKMEAITDPINGKLDDINERIRKWLAVDVTKWLETMKTYADGLDTPDTDDRGWSVVDYGFDAGGVGTDAQNRGRTLRGRGKRQIYEENPSP